MKALFILTSLFISTALFAQSPIETYKGLLLDLEQHVNYKPFKKVWKKQQSAWEEKVNSAKSVKELTDATAEFANAVFTAKQVKIAAVSTENLKEQSKGLNTVANLIKEDILKDWSGFADWSKKNDAFIAAEQAKDDEKKQMQRFQLISSVLKDFEKYFPEVFEDSKKGSFANTLEGKELIKDGQKFYNVKKVFPKGKGQIITVNSDNIYTFRMNYNTGEDVEVAQKILEELVNYLATNLPEGYAKTNMFDGSYDNTNRFVFEFKGESFSATAKKPSISIGRLKNVPTVMIEISEPIFKR